MVYQKEDGKSLKAVKSIAIQEGIVAYNFKLTFGQKESFIHLGIAAKDEEDTTELKSQNIVAMYVAENAGKRALIKSGPENTGWKDFLFVTEAQTLEMRVDFDRWEIVFQKSNHTILWPQKRQLPLPQ